MADLSRREFLIRTGALAAAAALPSVLAAKVAAAVPESAVSMCAPTPIPRNPNCVTMYFFGDGGKLMGTSEGAERPGEPGCYDFNAPEGWSLARGSVKVSYAFAPTEVPVTICGAGMPMTLHGIEYEVGA